MQGACCEVLHGPGFIFTDAPTHTPWLCHPRRCAFEAGQAEARCFNLVEEPGGLREALLGRWSLGGLKPRKVTFQAPSVDECCEWAIAVREAIGEATGKQIAY